MHSSDTFVAVSTIIKVLFCFQHGEPGAAVADLQPVDVVVSHVLNQILSPVCPIVYGCDVHISY